MRALRLVVAAALLAAIFVSSPANAAFELGDIICETTATTGTGTVNLGGAVSNYATFISQITTAATVPYTITSGDGKLETGIGTFTDATPDTLTRVANWSTDGSGAELTLSGTSTVCLGPTEQVFTGGVLQPGFLALELGTSGTTDTTIARSGAGAATLESKEIKRAGKQSMWIPAGSMKGNVTNPAVCGATFDSGSNDLTLNTCQFADGATELRVDFSFAMPKSWNESTITYTALWTAASGSGTFQAEVGCVAISNDDPLNATIGTTVTQVDTLTTAGDLHETPESSAITIAGTPAENDFVLCRLSRDTSVDTIAATIELIGVRLFWTDNAATLAE